jgi:hypothetical protein
MMKKNPVYVAGLERSGTSLMYALLASHPQIAMTRRTNMWAHFYNQYSDLADSRNFERCLESMMTYKRLIKLEPDPERIRREFRQGEPTYGRLFGLLESHYAERAGKPRWGDKSLHTERYTEPIFEAFPSARMLHMIRDPRDRYASSVTRWSVNRGGVGFGTAMWLDSLELAQRYAANYPEQYLIVRYETLANEPEATLRQVCDFIDESYSTEMLKMGDAGSFSGSNSSYGLDRPPGVISTDSIGRYRDVLSKRQITFIQAHANHGMELMGYEINPQALTWTDRLAMTLGDEPLNRARMLTWRTRESIRNRRGRPVPSYRIVKDSPYTSA